jgi:hypothetical protein
MIAALASANLPLDVFTTPPPVSKVDPSTAGDGALDPAVDHDLVS